MAFDTAYADLAGVLTVQLVGVQVVHPRLRVDRQRSATVDLEAQGRSRAALG